MERLRGEADNLILDAFRMSDWARYAFFMPIGWRENKIQQARLALGKAKELIGVIQLAEHSFVQQETTTEASVSIEGVSLPTIPSTASETMKNHEDDITQFEQNIIAQPLNNETENLSKFDQSKRYLLKLLAHYVKISIPKTKKDQQALYHALELGALVQDELGIKIGSLPFKFTGEGSNFDRILRIWEKADAPPINATGAWRDGENSNFNFASNEGNSIINFERESPSEQSLQDWDDIEELVEGHLNRSDVSVINQRKRTHKVGRVVLKTNDASVLASRLQKESIVDKSVGVHHRLPKPKRGATSRGVGSSGSK
jgi:hypothetical protein